MFQNIVISPLLWKDNNLEKHSKRYELISRLQSECFLCDKNKILFQECIEVSEEGSKKNNNFIFEQWLGLTTIDAKIKRIDNINLSKRKNDEFQRYYSEKLLASNDRCGIILSKEETDEIKNDLRKEIDIELLDVGEYLSPATTSKVRTIGRVSMKKDEPFDFWKWIHKYIRDTKTLVVHDGYACVPPQYKDLDFIIRNTPHSTNIKIITLSDAARNKSRDGEKDEIEVLSILNKLKTNYAPRNLHWEIRDDKKTITDRHIKTDYFIIDLGHALGATFKDTESGKVICKRQFTINTSPIG